MQGSRLNITHIAKLSNGTLTTSKILPIAQIVLGKKPESTNFAMETLFALCKLAKELNPHQFSAPKTIKDIVLQNVWNGDVKGFKTAIFEPYEKNSVVKNKSYFANFKYKLENDYEPANLCTMGRIERYILQNKLDKKICEQTYSNFFGNKLKSYRVDVMFKVLKVVNHTTLQP
jgi:hypothetical protein